MNDYRIQVHFRDTWRGFGERAEREEQTLESRHIRRSRASKALQQTMNARFPDHSSGVTIGHRKHAEYDVIKQFNQRSAGTEGDQGPEHGIVSDSGDHFDSALRHRHDAGRGRSAKS